MPDPGVFLSFNASDRELAQKLSDRLAALGLPVWMYTEEDWAGKPINAVIADGLATNSHMVILASNASLNARWCGIEWSRAQDVGLKLIPVILEECPFEDVLGGMGRLDLRSPDRLAEVAQEIVKQVRPDLGRASAPRVYAREPYGTAAGFTGRSREKNLLSDWLIAPKPPLFIWAALGGQGKTSLVSNWFCNEPLLGSRWEGVIWWSFYSPASLPDELVRHALTSILGECPEGLPHRLFAQLVEELRSRRFLLVLDGLERTLRGYTGADAIGSTDLDVALKEEERSFSDPNLNWFLRMMASTPQPAGRILLTTRDVPCSLENLEGCRVERLRDLPSDEAVAYLTSAGVSGEPHELEEAFSTYGRHPLGLKLLAGLVAQDPEAPGELKALRKYQVIPHLRDKLGDHQRHHILEHAYRSMPASSRGLLERLSLYRIPVDYPKLRVFAEDLPLNDAVIALETRGFIERVKKTEHTGATFDMHPIVRQYARRSFLATDPAGVIAAHRLVAIFFQLETGEELRDEFWAVPPQEERYVGPARQDADTIHGVDDIALVVELVHHLLASGDQDRAIVLLRDRLARLLVYKFRAFGLLKDLLDPVCFSPSAAAGAAEPLRPANDKQAWALNILANSYRNCVSACQAAMLHEIVAEWDQESSERLFAVRMVNLAIDQHLIGDFQQAEKNLLACLEISRRLGQLETNEISCLRELGDLYTHLGRFPEAATHLEKALQLARSQTSRYETGILINQAHLHLAQGDPFRALDLAKEAESASKRFKEPGRLDERHAIALCLTMGAPNRLEEAKGLLKEALHDAGNASLTVMRAQLMLALAQCSSGPEAEDLVQQGLRLAVEGDYVPLEADVYTGLGRLALLSNDFDSAQRYGERALTRSLQRKDPRTRAYKDIPTDNPYRYELGHRRATELLRQVAFARR